MKLDSADRTLREILNTYFFYIPRFQRPYSWEPEQVEELWEDAVQESAADYFIGSMVVHKKGEDTVAVIDGQQRITTLVMLLCAIRNAAQKHGHAGLANGTHTFIERKDENDESRFVLNTETSYPFLHDEIMSREDAELDTKVGREEEAIRAAYDRLVEFVDGTVAAILTNPTISKEKRAPAVGEALKKLRDKILGLSLIFVLVGDQDDATTIFVTLNSRGKDLEPADLVKAHLLQLLPKKQHLDKPRVKWEGIIDTFDAVDPPLRMTDFLLTSWRSRHSPTTAKKLHKDVRRKIKKAEAPGFLDELVDDSKLYLHATDPDTRKWSAEAVEAAESLRFFRDFGIRQPMPLLLSLVREYEEKRLSVPQLIRALRAVEDYVFTWTVLANKTSTGGMSLFYGRYAREVMGAKDKDARGVVINKLASELKPKRPLPAEFDESFGALWFTDNRPADKKRVQYALRRIYKHESPQGAAAIDFSHMTIEHLTSQSNGVTNGGRIGNLVYVTEALNSKLGNKGWGAKRAVLKETGDQWIPAGVIDATEWDAEAIDERTKALAELGRTKIWKG
ncbi:MAG: DUF262 domain-containing protein [Actinobacteria bacterium]|nr:DUF262 domain-containing protein [Actinomycetota bacterium]